MSDERFVSDEEVDKALCWLRDSATATGAAKSRSILSERMVRHIKALEMKRFSELPISAQEREAYASERYVEAINEEAIAAGEFEKLRALREAAGAKIEAWRSINANYRAMKI